VPAGRQGRPAHPAERRLTCRGQFHQVDTTAGGIPPPGDEALGIHRVQVVGERRLPDPHRSGQFPLLRSRWLLSENSTSQTGSGPSAAASASPDARLAVRAVRLRQRLIGVRAGLGMSRA
jgi:hypothetical protein